MKDTLLEIGRAPLLPTKDRDVFRASEETVDEDKKTGISPVINFKERLQRRRTIPSMTMVLQPPNKDGSSSSVRALPKRQDPAEQEPDIISLFDDEEARPGWHEEAILIENEGGPTPSLTRRQGARLFIAKSPPDSHPEVPYPRLVYDVSSTPLENENRLRVHRWAQSENDNV